MGAHVCVPRGGEGGGGGGGAGTTFATVWMSHRFENPSAMMVIAFI